MRSRFVNVRLDEAHLEKVRTLRQLGVVLADLVRDVWFDVFEGLVKYADHEPDWTDGCIAVLSGQDKGLKVWTYDREFHTIWRRPDGTPIPLAVR